MTFHIMVDLETLDTVATAKILSAGLVLFDGQGTIHRKLYRVVSLKDQIERTMSADTFHWWLRQSDEARAALQDKDKTLTPRGLLTAIKLFAQGYKDPLVWANGASFDLPMLEHMAAALEIPLPWAFWNHRCYRTVRALNRDVPEVKREGTYHNALDDALHQAHHLISIHRAKGGIL